MLKRTTWWGAGFVVWLAGCVGGPEVGSVSGEQPAPADTLPAEPVVEEPPAHQPNIPGRDTGFARDREAILSLAGGYLVDYRYEETAALKPGYQTARPFTSSAVEWVTVAQDTGERIVLQHLLVLGEPVRIVKHWQQTWDYAPAWVVRYIDVDVWQRQPLLNPGQSGRWSRTISEADGSPSYAAWGRWSHPSSGANPGAVLVPGPDASSWSASAAVFAPPPRRDGLRRRAYQAVWVRDRLDRTENGWRQQQASTKRWFNDQTPGLARESGVISYRRIDDQPQHAEAFRAAILYWRNAAPFWAEARRAWDDLFDTGQAVRLREEVNGEPRWRRVFKLASAISEAPRVRRSFSPDSPNEGGTAGEAIRDQIDEVLADYILEQ